MRPRSLTICMLLGMIVILASGRDSQAQPADAWKVGYQGREVNGPHVLGFWRFSSGKATEDSSGKHPAGTLTGAKFTDEGKFGGGLESFANGPGEDQRHALVIKNSPLLSPRGAFTIECWLKPSVDFPRHTRNAVLIDKKYVADADYQIALDPPNKAGQRLIRASLGFGTDSATWFSEPIRFTPGVWQHLAVTYDGRGQLRFFLGGRPVGGSTKPGRGGITAGSHPLSLGDRLGSTYAGFPGFLDEIRITDRVVEFRELVVADQNLRKVYLRGEPPTTLAYAITNRLSQPISGANVRIEVAGLDARTGAAPVALTLPKLAPGQTHRLEFPFNTRLRPDAYEIRISVKRPQSDIPIVEVFPIDLVARPVPDRLPVIMWGIGGIGNVVNETDRLKALGFTHCLGVGVDHGRVWAAGKPVLAVDEKQLPAAAAMFDHALRHDLRIISHLDPGRWLSAKPAFQRLNRAGKPYSRENLANAFPEVIPFFENVGASAAQTWGQFPAYEGGLINTEIRDGTQVSFRPQEQQAFEKAHGFPIPPQVVNSRGVSYLSLRDFPKDRVVPDDDPLRTFYRWFWTEGDGWNGWHSAVHRGFHSTGRKDLWTFFDPAVRCPTIAGSGGDVDYLSHWTYSYPDPIRIGLCADELFAMAANSQRSRNSGESGLGPQRVMKMTQVIWYRSQTAPTGASTDQASRSPWEDFDPDAAYITIAPAHLREAFWTKIARPVQGIMYHGWQSLVPGGHTAYRYTHPDTQHELARLVRDVVIPLGPMIKSVPAAPADVGFLESFTAQMFAARGTYGWGHSWAGDLWHALQYAHLQPEIVHEDHLGDLSRFKVLALPDCDVLPRSVVNAVLAYQKQGGIVIADDRLTPAIRPEILLPVVTRTKKADTDKQALRRVAQTLREKLDSRYRRVVDTSNPEVIPYRRQVGQADYVFLVNDHREFGDYVGRHGLVMENGLPSSATVYVTRPAGAVYDLRYRRAVPATVAAGQLTWPVNLGPADGAIFLVVPQAIEGLTVTAAESAKPGESLTVQAAVRDAQSQPVAAMIPLQVEIRDPAGKRAEGSGSYVTAADGTWQTVVDFAANDRPGVWEIRVTEGASGRTRAAYVRLAP